MNSFERTEWLRLVRLAEQIAYYHTHKRKCKCVCPVDAAWYSADISHVVVISANYLKAVDVWLISILFLLTDL